jgi:hypothetical protein
MRRQYSIILRVETHEGKRRYFVRQVSNSTEFTPGQVLSLDEVNELLNREHWHVSVVGDRKSSDDSTHTRTVESRNKLAAQACSRRTTRRKECLQRKQAKRARPRGLRDSASASNGLIAAVDLGLDVHERIKKTLDETTERGRS